MSREDRRQRLRSTTTSDFRKQYGHLPVEIRRQAQAAYKLWRLDPGNSSLAYKRVSQREPIFSARVGLHYRVLALVEDGEASWFWIGTHSDYDGLLRRL